jgi:hypothetical protein
MIKLLRNRWLHRALVAGVLIALGVGIYQVQEPEPMCVIDAGFVEPRCFIDCHRLVTLPLSQEQAVGAPNAGGMVEGVSFTPLPLKVWDTQSGAEMATFLDDKRKLGSIAFSKDGRRFAAEVVAFAPFQKITTALVLVDLDQGKVTEAPVHEATTFSQLIFSQEGNQVAWLSRRSRAARRPPDQRRFRRAPPGRCRRAVAVTAAAPTPDAPLPAAAAAAHAPPRTPPRETGTSSTERST